MRWTKFNIVSGRPWPEQLVRFAPYILIGVILVVLVPLLHVYIQSVVTEILIYAIFAMSLNLIYGYTGLFSLGHAAFFGVAAYTTGILLVRYGIDSFWLTAPAGILMAALVAAIFGVIALQVKGLYFLFVTMALGQLLSSVALKWRTVTGGSNGLVGIRYPVLGLSGSAINTTSFYFLVFIVFVICLFLLRRLVNSPFGQALQGTRDDEGRMRHLGYNTWAHKYLAFVIAGAFAGVAGVLFAHFSGIVAPLHLDVTTSTTVMLMVILGSTSVVFGPALGAAIVIILEQVASLYTPERWPMVLGGVFLITVMFLRGGITAHLVNMWNRIKYSYGSAKD
jgi:branched-chain amino acid transport system permease protein